MSKIRIIRGGPCDRPWVAVDDNQTNHSYSVNIEAFTIRFSHFFQARDFLETHDDYYSQSCSQMKGKLDDYRGRQVATYGNNGSDIISDVEYKVTRSTAVSLDRRLISDTHGVKIFFVFRGNGVLGFRLTMTAYDKSTSMTSPRTDRDQHDAHGEHEEEKHSFAAATSPSSVHAHTLKPHTVEPVLDNVRLPRWQNPTKAQFVR